MTLRSSNSPTLYEFTDPFDDKTSDSRDLGGPNDNHPYRRNPRANPPPRQRLKRLAQTTRQAAALAELAYMELAARPPDRRPGFGLRYVLAVAAFASAFGALVGVGGTYLFYRPPRPTRTVHTRQLHHVRPATARSARPTATAAPAGIATTPPTEPRSSTWSISRTLLAQLYEDQISGRSTVRFVPHIATGQAVGLKVYGVRRGSYYAELGLQNGDLLLAVNGLPLSQPDRLRWDLAADDVLAVLLERRGEPRIQVYTVDR